MLAEIPGITKKYRKKTIIILELDMGKNRLEAFSDGVIAIIITIMVLEMKVPHGDTVNDLIPLIPVFISYILSFIYLGIYWNNHHHMLHTMQHVSGSILWANLHLLFWLSLIPFATGWMGENHFASIPTALYGVTLSMTALAYTILQIKIIKSQGRDSILKKAIGSDWKGKSSLIVYILGVIISCSAPKISIILYFLIAAIWFIPDKRIEKITEH